MDSVYNLLIRWLHWLDFRFDCTKSLLRRRHQDGPSRYRLRLSQAAVPMIVGMVLQVCAPPPQKMCLLWFSQHRFACMRHSPHVFDFLRLFQALFRHPDFRDFLQLAVGVVWGVLSNGIALPASILHAKGRSGPKQTHCPCCVMGLRAIRGIRTTACRDSMVIGLPPVSLDTSKRRLSSHTTDLSAVEYGTPAAAS